MVHRLVGDIELGKTFVIKKSGIRDAVVVPLDADADALPTRIAEPPKKPAAATSNRIADERTAINTTTVISLKAKEQSAHKILIKSLLKRLVVQGLLFLVAILMLVKSGSVFIGPMITEGNVFVDLFYVDKPPQDGSSVIARVLSDEKFPIIFNGNNKFFSVSLLRLNIMFYMWLLRLVPSYTLKNEQ